jgi:hypothetical protein
MNIQKNQKGAVLLALSVALVTTTATVLAMTMASRPAVPTIPSEMRDLENVKAALMSYAASYTNSTGPGRLPCPADARGLGEGACNGNKPGYVPAKSADGRWHLQSLGTLHSNFNYAVDRSFRENNRKDLNSKVEGGLRLDGETNFVAMVMLPGKIAESASEFSNNINDNGTDFSRGANTKTNARDYVVGIRLSELMTVATASVASLIKTHLDTFYKSTGTFPTSNSELNSALASMPSWFAGDKWDNVLSYNLITSDSFSVSFDGCAITYSSSITKQTLLRDMRTC